jgi:hypothetical protein
MEVAILAVIFGSIFGVFYLYLSTRNKERLALIEKGADASIFMKGNAKNAAPNNKYITKTFDSFNDAMQGGSAYPNNTGRLTVIYEQGFVSPMSKCDIGIPMSAAFYTSMVFRASIPAAKVSLPCYKLNYADRMLQPVNVSVYSYGKLVALDNTSTLVDTLAMAAKSLQEDYPAILTIGLWT